MVMEDKKKKKLEKVDEHFFFNLFKNSGKIKVPEWDLNGQDPGEKEKHFEMYLTFHTAFPQPLLNS